MKQILLSRVTFLLSDFSINFSISSKRFVRNFRRWARQCGNLQRGRDKEEEEFGFSSKRRDFFPREFRRFKKPSRGPGSFERCGTARRSLININSVTRRLDSTDGGFKATCTAACFAKQSRDVPKRNRERREETAAGHNRATHTRRYVRGFKRRARTRTRARCLFFCVVRASQHSTDARGGFGWLSSGPISFETTGSRGEPCVLKIADNRSAEPGARWKRRMNTRWTTRARRFTPENTRDSSTWKRKNRRIHRG